MEKSSEHPLTRSDTSSNTSVNSSSILGNAISLSDEESMLSNSAIEEDNELPIRRSLDEELSSDSDQMATKPLCRKETDV